MTNMVEYVLPHELIEDKYKRLGISINELRSCIYEGKCSQKLLEMYDEAYYDLRDYEKLVRIVKEG